MLHEPRPLPYSCPHTPHFAYTQRLVPSSAQAADVAAIMRALALTNHAGAGPLVQACLLHALRRCDAGVSSIRPRHRAEEEEEGHRMGGNGSGGGERGGGGGYSAEQLAEVMSSLAELRAAQGDALQMEELDLLDDAERRRWRQQYNAVQGGGGGGSARSGSEAGRSVLPRVVQQLLGHLCGKLVERPTEFR